MVPAALWAGVITPVVEEKIVLRNISISTYQTTNLSALLEGDVELGHISDGVWLTKNGISSFDMNAIRGQMLNSASFASAINNGTTRIHAKLDSTGFSYANRSYKIGATVGFATIPDTKGPIRYTYNETGFETTVSCIYNRSSDYYLVRIPTSENIHLTIYETHGLMANNLDAPSYVQVGYLRQDILAWGLRYLNTTRSSSLAIVTPADLTSNAFGFFAFNASQCQLQFVAKNFEVNVHTGNSTIVVSPKEEIEWPDYADVLLTSVTSGIASFTYADGAFLGSVLGRALHLNANVLAQLRGEGDQTILSSLEDFVSSVFDNALVAMSTATFVGTNATTARSAQVVVYAVVFGSSTYIYAAIGVHAIVCAIYIFEAVRTRGWSKATAFDPLDIGNAVLAASAGGKVFSESFEAIATVDKAFDDPKISGMLKLRLRRQRKHAVPAKLVVEREHMTLHQQDSSVPLRRENLWGVEGGDEIVYTSVPDHETLSPLTHPRGSNYRRSATRTGGTVPQSDNSSSFQRDCITVSRRVTCIHRGAIIILACNSWTLLHRQDVFGVIHCGIRVLSLIRVAHVLHRIHPLNGNSLAEDLRNPSNHTICPGTNT